MRVSDSQDGRGKRITSSQIQGLKYFKILRPLLKRLHSVGVARDSAGNRKLFMDQYCLLLLLWIYSPIVDSMRGLQQVAALKKVQKKFGIPRASMGSLSEAVNVFDPQAIKQIALELANRLPNPQVPKRLSALHKTLVAVDGSVVKVLAQVAELAWINQSCCGYRLHTHFEVLRGVAKRMDATSANPKGSAAETAVLEQTLQAEHCYVMDRGYVKYQLWNKIHALDSNYVCRLSDKVKIQTLQEYPLTEQDKQANVFSDQLIELGSDPSNCPDHRVRMVCVRCSPHTSRGRRKKGGFSSTGPSSDGVLRIATDMLDMPAELIAELYRLRWTIELFFRTFKQLLGCRHLLSHKQNGVEIQVYCALIACMLIVMYSGRQPTKRTFELLCFYMSGWATVDEVEKHLTPIKAQPP